jgi:formiminotetrahydrofolate cyclodeaminase
MTIREDPIGSFAAALAARSPTPGGGAAAAICAALGVAAGAMAARYTTGPKWGALSPQAQALAETLDGAARDCLALADQDALAFAALGAARREQDALVISHAEERAQAVPAELLALCALHASALRAFLALGNPALLSDVKVGIHLLAGAGRASWQTLLVNQPGIELQRIAAAHLSALAQAEGAALSAILPAVGGP